MKAINIEIRQLIVRAKSLGKTIKEIAHLYNVSTRSVNRICSLHRDTNSLAHIKSKGRQSKLTDSMKAAIYAKMEAEPGCTLLAMIEDLALPINQSSLHKFLEKSGYSYKKKLYTHNTNREKMSFKKEHLGKKSKRI